MELLDLPNDLLIEILRCTDRTSLCTIAKVCRRLKTLSLLNVLWRPFCRACTVCPSEEQWDKELSRSFSWKEIYQISMKWESKYCKETRFVQFAGNLQMPWMQLSSATSANCLLVTEGSQIVSYAIGTPAKKRQNRRQITSYCGHTDDVVRFAIDGDGTLVSCSLDKTTRVWSMSDNPTCDGILSGHSKGVYCVDATHDYIASGSKDNTIKVWKKDKSACESTLDVGDHIWSAMINPFCSSELFAGTAGKVHGVSALQLYDVISSTSIIQFSNPPADPQKHGAGILQILSVDGNCVMSCGYDAAVRCWDTRIGQCVKTWEDPHDNAIYCLALSSNTAFVTGACRFGMVHLWDRRFSRPVETYFVGRSNNGKGSTRHQPARCNSPVYSLQMTFGILYVGLSHGVTRLSFL